MKRTPLNRRTPLQRKTWMKRMSAKRAKLIREAKPERDEYRDLFVMCQVCLRRKATDVHEICRGTHREAALRLRCAWLCCCRTCHRDELADASRWPISRQLACKLVGDPEFFDLELVNRLRGREVDAITLPEVAKWLKVA